MITSCDKKRVLVAEDNLALLCLIRVTLVEAGCEVMAVQNGEQALAAMREADFDLVVTDYQMPVLDGFGLCKQMREDSRLSEIPVLLLTAKMFELDMDEAQQTLGLFSALPKPFSPRELARLVLERLGCAVT